MYKALFCLDKKICLEDRRLVQLFLSYLNYWYGSGTFFLKILRIVKNRNPEQGFFSSAPPPLF